MATRVSMTQDPVGPALLRLTGPMAVAMLAFLVFNIVDTFYVGQLGADELAAMAFTFPVVFTVMSLSFGLGAGASAVIARAAGAGDYSRVKRLTTDGIFLGLVLVILVATVGWFTIDPLFRALGAEGRFLELVREYMAIWYLGVGFVVLPMTGNNAIRALGDTKTPAKIMIIASMTNLVLDPLFIFGIGPFPRLELQGAAIATVIAYMVTFVAAFWVLARRERLLVRPDPRTLRASWTAILHIAVPAAFTSMLTPITLAWLTRLAATQGPDVVAAFGVAGRIEGLGLIGINAMGSVLTPFMGQNLGAARKDRIDEARNFSFRFAALWGLSVALVLALAAPWIAAAFSPAVAVQQEIHLLLLIIPLTYFAGGWINLAANASNGLGQPRDAVVLNVFRLAVVGVAASTGVALAASGGLYAGIAAANIASGAFAWWLMRKRVAQCDPRSAPQRLPVPEPAGG